MAHPRKAVDRFTQKHIWPTTVWVELCGHLCEGLAVSGCCNCSSAGHWCRICIKRAPRG